jgi:NAD(P)-dependent dehydrogenase (short-subunit alcohol dehydrogenase family)
MRLKDKVCLVTGSSRGIGKAIALALAHEGAKIAVAYHTQKSDAMETINEITGVSHTRRARAHVLIGADVSKEEEVNRMIRETKKAFGTIDILVNNAGIHRDSISWKMDKKIWKEVLATNLTGPFLCTKHVLPIMRKRGWGRIINISSVIGETGLAGASNYAASKAGLVGFTKAVAKEVADKNITVNCVAYGYINAGMNLRLPEENRQKVLQNILLKRFGTLEEATGPVVFLCTDAASYITGQTIHVNGGYYL